MLQNWWILSSHIFLTSNERPLETVENEFGEIIKLSVLWMSLLGNKNYAFAHNLIVNMSWKSLSIFDNNFWKCQEQWKWPSKLIFKNEIVILDMAKKFLTMKSYSWNYSDLFKPVLLGMTSLRKWFGLRYFLAIIV